MLVGDGETMRSNSVDEMTNKPKRKTGKKNTMKHKSQCGKTRRISFIHLSCLYSVSSDVSPSFHIE